jgi:restriction system protein
MPPAPDNPGLDDSDIAEIIERSWLYDDELTQIAAEIRQWEEDDVLALLRSLLMQSGPLGIDEERRKQAQSRPDLRTASAREYWRRLDEYHLLAPHAGKRRIGDCDVNIPDTIPYPWEGITWVLDLLHTSPDSALRVISAYLDSHFYVLPDGRLSALDDAALLIRTYYIGLPEHTEDRIDLIAGRTPIEFERLVARLYKRMGYEVTLTPVVGDDGIDLFATGSEPGRHEKLCIQCKTSRNTIPIKDVRELGYAAHKHQATKGVFVTTSRFSPAARKEELLNTHLELLDGQQLVLLLNLHLGHEWPLNLERLVAPSPGSR